MSLLPPALLQRLGRSRLAPRQASASIGVGERRSRAIGGGIEFADHRPYQPGDDVRHLDPHLHHRHGSYYIRQFQRDQQLRITIAIDGSASMAFGQPQKFAYARQLAAALGYLGLNGGDQVQAVVLRADRLSWSPRFHGVQRAPRYFQWLEHQRPHGTPDLAGAAPEIASNLHSEGLMVILSDWMMDGVEKLLGPLRAARQELVAVQVLAPEELEPEQLGLGEARLVDGETGIDIDLGLDADAYHHYHRELDAWRRSCREQLLRHEGSWLEVRSGAALERLLLRDWRASGLVV